MSGTSEASRATRALARGVGGAPRRPPPPARPAAGPPPAQVDLPAVGDERNVRALTRHAGLAEGDGIVPLFDLALRAVKGAGFEEDHGVRISYGGDHHTLHVVWRDGRDDLEAREGSVHVLQGAGVLGGELNAAAVRAPDYQRHLDLTAGEVADLGGVRVEPAGGRKRGVPGHHPDDGLHPHHRHPAGRPGEAEFAYRGVYYPLRAVLVYEAVGYEVGAAVDADVLDHERAGRV